MCVEDLGGSLAAGSSAGDSLSLLVQLGPWMASLISAASSTRMGLQKQGSVADGVETCSSQGQSLYNPLPAGGS